MDSRPQPAHDASNASNAPDVNTQAPASKKKRHRAGRKKRARRQSFAAPSESATNDMDDDDRRPSLLDGPRPSANDSFYRLRNGGRSNTSLDSDHLLDHRDELPFRARRRSNSQNMLQSMMSSGQSLRPPSRGKAPKTGHGGSPNKSRLSQVMGGRGDEEDDSTDRTPLLASGSRGGKSPLVGHGPGNNFGGNGTYTSSYFENHRRGSANSPESKRHNLRGYGGDQDDDDYDVNNPPSMPGSPKLGSLDDVMMRDDFHGPENDDAIIDIEGASDGFQRGTPPTPSRMATDGRRRTLQDLAEMDVCYPVDNGLSEIGEEDPSRDVHQSPRRRRRRQWPDLEILDDWANQEKEWRNAEQIQAKKMTEPVMVGGRLRNAKQIWHKQEDDAPYRYTYFNETFEETIHSRTISELCQFGATFETLFRPEPAQLSDESSDDDDADDNMLSPAKPPSTLAGPTNGRGRASLTNQAPDTSRSHSGSLTPGAKDRSQAPTPLRNKRFGPRPTFWLDVLSPTETEMKVLAKTFGIHQLTVEDILVQEPREKVELFNNYYFVNYRSFEQDKDSEDYMEPINIYVIVYRDGVLSFHFSMTPHPANVRRRIRQLGDYMTPSADWISYAIIDDVTDAYAPLVQQVEDEVDNIDDHILELHSASIKDDDADDGRSMNEKGSVKSASSTKSRDPDEGGKMLRRVGEGRKKVMSLYRLLGNKADVIKGFAKRCTEQWQVAPRSEIGLYLGDIQDHIVTMTGNLSHYENLLSRAHSNYLAQINIRTSERAEKTNDVLNKLTVLGTIVLPMNVVTGIWGMNCWVPGQDKEYDFTWFFGITGGLLAFGLTCYLLAKKLYGIV